MAANEFYNSPYGHPPRYDQVSPAPDPFRRQHAATPVSSISPYAPSDPDLQHPQHSHQSLSSDPSVYPAAGGRGNNEADQYADNIPLKSHAPYGSSPYANEPPASYMQPTRLPPSPEVIEPQMNRTRKKKGFFQKKLPWVTYTLTTVQIVVFIVELVKMGTYFFFFSVSTVDWICVN